MSIDSIYKLNKKSKYSKYESTYEKIIRVASNQFARNGYKRSTLDIIGEGCGIKKQTILYHFKDKNDLLLACLNYWFDNCEEQILIPALSKNSDSNIERKRFAQRVKVYFFYSDFGILLDHFRWLKRVESKSDEIVRRIDRHLKKWTEVFLFLFKDPYMFYELLGICSLISMEEKNKETIINNFYERIINKNT